MAAIETPGLSPATLATQGRPGAEAGGSAAAAAVTPVLQGRAVQLPAGLIDATSAAQGRAVSVMVEVIRSDLLRGLMDLQTSAGTVRVALPQGQAPPALPGAGVSLELTLRGDRGGGVQAQLRQTGGSPGQMADGGQIGTGGAASASQRAGAMAPAATATPVLVAPVLSAAGGRLARPVAVVATPLPAASNAPAALGEVAPGAPGSPAAPGAPGAPGAPATPAPAQRLSLSLVAVTLPAAAGPTAAPPAPSSSAPAPAGAVHATILEAPAPGPGGAATVTAELAGRRVSLELPAPLPPGTRLILVPQPPAIATSGPRPWPALGAALANPAVQPQVAEAVARALPSADNPVRVAAQLVAAAHAGAVAAPAPASGRTQPAAAATAAAAAPSLVPALGPEAAALAEGDPALVRALRAAIAEGGQGATSLSAQGTRQDWRSAAVAVQDGGQIQRLDLYWAPPATAADGDPEAEAEGQRRAAIAGGGHRFLVDVSPEHLGPVQIDGLMRPGRLDVIVRLERSLPDGLLDALEPRLLDLLSASGLTGSLQLRTGVGPDWVRLMPNRAGAGTSIQA